MNETLQGDQFVMDTLTFLCISKTVTLEESVSPKSTELSLSHFTESSVKKSTVLEKLHDFDLDEILRKIEENPRSVSACDLLKAWETILKL